MKCIAENRKALAQCVKLERDIQGPAAHHQARAQSQRAGTQPKPGKRGSTFEEREAKRAARDTPGGGSAASAGTVPAGGSSGGSAK